MVLLHVKMADDSSFLFQTTVQVSILDLIPNLVKIQNTRLRIQRFVQGKQPLFHTTLLDHSFMHNLSSIHLRITWYRSSLEFNLYFFFRFFHITSATDNLLTKYVSTHNHPQSQIPANTINSSQDPFYFENMNKNNHNVTMNPIVSDYMGYEVCSNELVNNIRKEVASASLLISNAMVLANRCLSLIEMKEAIKSIVISLRKAYTTDQLDIEPGILFQVICNHH